MDISTPILFVVAFLIASISLFLVYKYGIKEKSYEEALAEQRQQVNALLGPKSKPKEKKNKKASKKSKEKSHENETDGSENNESKENSSPNKVHVEFKEIVDEVPNESELKVPAIKEMSKKDDIFKVDPVKEKATKEKKPATESNALVKNKKNNKPVSVINKNEPSPSIEKDVDEKIESVLEVTPVTSQTIGAVIANPGKEKKKKKNELNSRQLTAEKDELINSVREAELSKTEIQLLIDLLLNKQLEAPAVISDWSEGKYDPVQKLKKQLAEKEKALTEEQEALTGAQAKLKEIRAEQQAEKTQLQQKIRVLEELSQTRLIEVQAANNRIQADSQKIQQLQAEMNSEMIKIHKLIEDNSALQMQVQQYEASLSQMQDTDNMIGKYRIDIDELSTQNQQLRMDLQQVAAEKEHQHQHFVMQITNMDKGYKESIQELEKNLEMALRQENEFKNEISRLDSALQKKYEEERKLELTLSQMKEQLRLMNNEKIETAKYVVQLTTELQSSKEEIKQLNQSVDGKQLHEVEILNLSNELASKNSELSAKIAEWQQAEKKYKADLETSNKNYLKIQQELEDQKIKNNKLSKDIATKEQSSQKEFLQRLFPEIEQLKAATAEDWQAEYGRLIRNHLVNLQDQCKQTKQNMSQSQDVDNMQSQLLHYKRLIDDTDKTLTNLQEHIEKEEISWRSQLAAKEAEIENLKENHVSQLKSKVVELEKQLAKEVAEKQQLQQDSILLKSQVAQSTARNLTDSTSTIERLSEEVNRLGEQLIVEQTKNGDVAVNIKAKKCSNSTNGTSFSELQHCLSSSSSSHVEDLNKKPKNKKRKKKVPIIKNTSICSNMGCQFLYCDSNNCGKKALKTLHSEGNGELQ